MLKRFQAELERVFKNPFRWWDGDTGQAMDGQPEGTPAWNELLRSVARLRQPQFVVDSDSVLMLALPMERRWGGMWVATAPFLIRPADPASPDWDEVRDWLGMDEDAAWQWARGQRVWEAELLLSLAEAVSGKLSAEAQAERMKNEVEQLSHNLASTYEEISLLYTVTQNLRISSTDEELGRLALDWLVDCLPAEGFCIQYLPVPEDAATGYKGRKHPVLVTNGDCPVDSHQLTQLIHHLDLEATAGPLVANERVTGESDWPLPLVRQLILVPLSEGDNLFGWLAAINHTSGEEFGTVEANLLSSLGALLGIHGSNRELYRQQSELLANVVRALVSAIDAKDPYTSGHSDRVARFAVRIALELRCHPKLVNTIYMAGLLHDVGKIGIDDNVLRKPGRLTDAEFEHIKMHPELGYKILADIKQLSDVLPAVLHHHEQWDGQGYPHGLAGEEIPQIARIMAVADAYDAMTSDRPYRNGMPDEKVDAIFREGAGGHWDPEVVKAYFAAKVDIEEIARRERSQLEAVEELWV